MIHTNHWPRPNIMMINKHTEKIKCSSVPKLNDKKILRAWHFDVRQIYVDQEKLFATTSDQSLLQNWPSGAQMLGLGEFWCRKTWTLWRIDFGHRPDCDLWFSGHRSLCRKLILVTDLSQIDQLVTNISFDAEISCYHPLLALTHPMAPVFKHKCIMGCSSVIAAFIEIQIS